MVEVTEQNLTFSAVLVAAGANLQEAPRWEAFVVSPRVADSSWTVMILPTAAYWNCHNLSRHEQRSVAQRIRSHGRPRKAALSRVRPHLRLVRMPRGMSHMHTVKSNIPDTQVTYFTVTACTVTFLTLSGDTRRARSALCRHPTKCVSLRYRALTPTLTG